MTVGIIIAARLFTKDVYLEGRLMGSARTRGETAKLLDDSGHHEAADAARSPNSMLLWDVVETPRAFDVRRQSPLRAHG